jgi:hypothetical protein
MYDTNNEPVRRGRDEVIEGGRDVVWLLEQASSTVPVGVVIS